MLNRKVVSDLLLQKKYDVLIDFAEKDYKKTLKFIQMELYHHIDQPIRWHAIEALGLLAKHSALNSPEIFKNLLGRFLWAMNDESGNVPWSSTEAMASIIAYQPNLFGDFTPLLITNGLDNPMCHRGTIWGAGRISQVDSKLVVPFKNQLLHFLDTKNVHILAYSIWLFGLLGKKEVEDKIVKHIKREEKTYIFIDGELRHISIGELARNALVVLRDHAS